MAESSVRYASAYGNDAGTVPYATEVATHLRDDGKEIQDVVISSDGSLPTVEERKQTPTGNALNVQIGPGDPISNIPVVIDFDHHQIHEGETFWVTELQSLGTSTVKYGFTVPVYANTIQAPHLIIDPNCYADTGAGGALIQVYEGATFTGGSSMTAYNRNRNSSITPVSSIKTGVTSTNGTLILSHYFGTDADARAVIEFICKSNVIYRIDIIGQKTGTLAAPMFTWYEDLGV